MKQNLSGKLKSLKKQKRNPVAADLGVLVKNQETSSVLPGATVTIRQEIPTAFDFLRGTTNSSGIAMFLGIPAGNYEIIVSSPGFLGKTIITNVVDFSSNEAVVELTPKEEDEEALPSGSLQFTPNILIVPTGDTQADDWFQPTVITNPTGASVMADNSGIQDQVIISPAGFIMKRRDRKLIRISKEGFLDENFTIPGQFKGKKMDIIIDLRPDITESILGFSSTPSGAEIFINDLSVGKVPISIGKEQGSSHVVRAILPDHQDNIQTLIWPSTPVSEPFNFVMEPIIIPTEEPTWWQRIISITPINIFADFLSQFTFFRNAYFEIFGKEPTESEIDDLSTKIIDFIIPVNTLSKLFTGKNLKGESEEFGSSEDWLDLILSAAIIIPVGKVAGAGTKIAISKISTAGAASLTEQLGKEVVAKRLIKTIQTHPETSGKFLAKFPLKVREAVISGLYRTSAGRIAIVTLHKTGYFKALRPFWLKVLTNAGATTGVAALLVGAIGSYPFAGFIKEESLQTLGFAVNTARKNKDLEGLRIALDKQLEVLDITLWENFLAKIPYANVVAQLRDFFDAAKIKLEIDERGFEELKRELEEEPSPLAEAISVTSLDVFPTVTDIGNSVTLTARVQNTSSNDVPTNIEFVVVKPDGTSLIETIENVVMPANFSNDAVLILETAGFPSGFYDVNIGVFETGTNVTLATKSFPRAFQLTEKEEFTLPPEEQVATLIIKGKPDDAIIEVANRPEITGQGTFEVPAGNYDVRASKEEFTSRNDRFFLDVGEERTFAFNLQEIDVEEPQGSITINTIPSGAKVSVDGVFEFADTPVTVFQKAGDHLVRMALDDHIPKEETLTWEDNVQSEETFVLEEEEEPPPIPKARLEIRSSPTGARVSINGETQFANTPFTSFLEAGTYLIRVEASGLEPQEEPVTLKSGDSKVIIFTLSQEAGVGESEIIIVPSSEIPVQNFSLLDTPEVELTPSEPISPAARKEIMINIETTDLLPWKGRIYSIAYKDLSAIDSEIIVLTNNNEKALIEEFISIFEIGDFKRIVGYNLAFDYRYIFSKLWLYRLQSITLKEAKLRDLMQIMKQVKEEFVFGFQKNGTLNDWGKYLFGVGKFGSQETILREYISGNFEYVRAFQERQIELTQGLYNLARFSFGEGFIETIEASQGAGPAPETSGSSHLPVLTKEKECKNCIQMNPLNASECKACGAKL